MGVGYRGPRYESCRRRPPFSGRYQLHVWSAIVCSLLLARGASARIFITEIHYHPAGSQAEAEALEFVELMNDEPIPFDVSGYRLAGGIDYTFPPGTIIGGGEVLVVASDPEFLAAAHGIEAPLGPFAGRLNNGGEEVLLIDTGGSTIGRVR